MQAIAYVWGTFLGDYTWLVDHHRHHQYMLMYVDSDLHDIFQHKFFSRLSVHALSNGKQLTTIDIQETADMYIAAPRVPKAATK